MSREILFRGKRKDWKELPKEEWLVEGYCVHTEEKAYIILDIEVDCVDGENTDLYATEWYEVDKDTVGQYIGIPDKNGNEIYEGDICKYYNSEDKDGIAIIREDYAEWIGGTIHQKEIMTPLFYLKCSEEWEVIGNVYENADLLKEEENE